VRLRPYAVRLYPTHMTEAPFIGVVSDTHGYYDPMLDDLFAGAAAIVHAGDVGGLDVLQRLRALAPLTVVAGNTDLPQWGHMLPWETTVEIAGLRVIVCHIVASLMSKHDPVAEGFDLVVSGHSHKAAVEWREETLFLNPGSAGRARFGKSRTAALVYVKAGRPEPCIEVLD
jgi:putative phosphoesterase